MLVNCAPEVIAVSRWDKEDPAPRPQVLGLLAYRQVEASGSSVLTGIRYQTVYTLD